MHISRELQALFSATHPDPPPGSLAHIRDQISLGVLDLNELICLARRHRVVAILARRMLDAGITGDAYGAFSRRLGRQTRTRKVLKDAQSDLIETLHAQGIDVLVLKGSAVATRLYRNSGDRQSKDIDLLIRPQHFDLAFGVLKQNGFVLRFPIQRCAPAQQDALLRMACDASFVRPSDAVQVELHWRTDRSRAYLDLNHAMFRKPPGQQVTGPDSTMMPLAEQILYLCAHGAKHSWFRLYWLMDIARAVHSLDEPTWHAIVELATIHGHSRTVATALQLVWQAYQIPLPNHLTDHITTHHDRRLTRFCWNSLLGTDGRTRIRMRDARFVLDSFSYRLRLKSAYRYKLSLVYQSFIEPRDIGWIGLSGKWLPVYILIAPVSGALRIMSRG